MHRVSPEHASTLLDLSHASCAAARVDDADGWLASVTEVGVQLSEALHQVAGFSRRLPSVPRTANRLMVAPAGPRSVSQQNPETREKFRFQGAMKVFPGCAVDSDVLGRVRALMPPTRERWPGVWV